MGIMVKGDLNKQFRTEAVTSGTKEVWNNFLVEGVRKVLRENF